MKLVICFFILFVFSLSVCADSFSIEAEYSYGVGIPISDIEDKAFTTLHTKAKLITESQCLRELNSKNLSMLALGQAANARATDVVIKCVKYWKNSDCDSIYPGCIGRADIKGVKHLHFYNNVTMVPKYLMFNNESHQVLQSIMFTESHKNSSELEVVFVVQVKYDPVIFHELLGASLTCEDAIKTKIVENVFRQEYFVDARTKAYKFNCYNVDASGKSKLSGEKVIRAN